MYRHMARVRRRTKVENEETNMSFYKIASQPGNCGTFRKATTKIAMQIHSEASHTIVSSSEKGK